MAITARDEDAAFTAFEFSREFEALLPVKLRFGTDKLLNSLENLSVFL
jgi:hypothetical protein